MEGRSEHSNMKEVVGNESLETTEREVKGGIPQQGVHVHNDNGAGVGVPAHAAAPGLGHKADGHIGAAVLHIGRHIHLHRALSGLGGLAAGGAESPMEQILLQQLLSALSDLKGEVRMDLESNMLYLSAPASFRGMA